VEGNRLVGWKEAQVHHKGREENKREKERITQRQLRNSVGCVN
jgi:bisphosphoglycerate-dependent phosphoglycerate mutase